MVVVVVVVIVGATSLYPKVDAAGLDLLVQLASWLAGAPDFAAAGTSSPPPGPSCRPSLQVESLQKPRGRGEGGGGHSFSQTESM